MREVKSSADYTDAGNSLLTIGHTGSGKTEGFVTIPGRKFAYLFDPNAMQTLKASKNVDYVEFLPEHIDLDAVTLRRDKQSGDVVRDAVTKAPEPRTYIEFEQDFEDRMEKGFFDNYDAIAFDSMTTMTDIVQDRIMYLNGRFGKWPEIADYTATINTVIKILRTATSLRKKSGEPLLLYLTGHIDTTKDEITGKIVNQMAFLGALRRRVPLLFANIWLCYADQDKNGKTQWYVRVHPDRDNPYLRCSIRGLNDTENVTIDDWNNPEGEGIGGLLHYKP